MLQIQDIAGRLLKCGYASFRQFAELGAGGTTMNNLGRHLAVIWEMEAALELE